VHEAAGLVASLPQRPLHGIAMHPGSKSAYGLALGFLLPGLLDIPEQAGDQPQDVRRLGPALVFTDWARKARVLGESMRQ
jgi:hypothetical protein